MNMQAVIKGVVPVILALVVYDMFIKDMVAGFGAGTANGS